jgi:hypothetical protein
MSDEAGRPITLAEAAWHEAGHAVAAWALGAKIRSCSVPWALWARPGNSSSGHTHSVFYASPGSPIDRIEVCTVHVAGAVTQARFSGKPMPLVMSRHALTDFRQAAGLLGVPIRSDAEHHTLIDCAETGSSGCSVNDAISRATELLNDHRELTEAVARHLARYRRLSGKRLRRIACGTVEG